MTSDGMGFVTDEPKQEEEPGFSRGRVVFGLACLVCLVGIVIGVAVLVGLVVHLFVLALSRGWALV